MKQLSPIQAFGLTLLFSLPFYFGLGNVRLFDWDEINFAECAREMLVSGDFSTVQIGFEPFYEKPPLFIWLQALCMSIFGVNEFAARLPNALCGTTTLWVLFSIGTKLKNHRFGLLWALVYVASLLPHFYFKFGIIDPVFNLFIFLSLYQVILICEGRLFDKKNALYAGLFSGLAVLTKGPVGLLLLLLTFIVYQAVTRFKQFPKIKAFLWFALSFTLIVCSWFAVSIISNGWDLFWQFINYQVELFTKPVAGHEQPFYYHFVVVLLGCFPMSFYAIPAFRSKVYATPVPMHFRTWMLSLFWVVMILFSITTTKIVHYSSLAYLPLSFMAATFLFRLEDKQRKIPKVLNGFVLGFGLLLALVFITLPYIMQGKDQWINSIKMGEFERASLNVAVDWPWWLSGIGVFMLAVSITGFVLRRKGQITKAIALKALNTSLLLVSVFWVIMPRIEQYTQAPAIEFMQNRAKEDVYLTTLGYKSYANYFYFQYPNQADKRTDEPGYLLDTDMGKPVYFITKLNSHDAETKPNLKQIGAKGGFKFYIKSSQYR